MEKSGVESDMKRIPMPECLGNFTASQIKLYAALQILSDNELDSTTHLRAKKRAGVNSPSTVIECINVLKENGILNEFNVWNKDCAELFIDSNLLRAMLIDEKVNFILFVKMYINVEPIAGLYGTKTGICNKIHCRTRDLFEETVYRAQQLGIWDVIVDHNKCNATYDINFDGSQFLPNA